MIRVLTILAAVVALAFTASPASARRSPPPMYSPDGAPTAKYYLDSAGLESGSLRIRFAWRTPNPRRTQEFTLLQTQIEDALAPPHSAPVGRG